MNRSSTPHNKTQYILLLLIMICASFLRVYQLGTESIWLDEADGILKAGSNLSQLYEISKGDVHAPLYFYILHFVLWFGESEFLIRLPSVFFGILTIPLLFFLCKKLFDARVGIVCSFLISISMMHIFYSQEARMYSLIILLTLGSITFFYYAIEDNKKYLWTAFTLLSIVAIYTHYFSFFILGVEMLFFLLATVSIRRKKPYIQCSDIYTAKMVVVNIGMVMVAFMPRILVFIRQADSRVGKEVTWGMDKADYFLTVLLQFTIYAMEPSFVMYLLIVLCAVGAVISSYKTKKQFFLVFVWFVLPVLSGYYLTEIMPFEARYIIFALPAFLIFISKGIVALVEFFFQLIEGSVKQKRQNYAITAIVMLLLFIEIPLLKSYYTTIQKNDWRRAVAFLKSKEKQGDVIVPLPTYMQSPLNYYYRKSPGKSVIQYIKNTPEEINRIVLQTLPKRTYFILTEDINAVDPEGNMLAWFSRNARLVDKITGIYIYTPIL